MQLSFFVTVLVVVVIFVVVGSRDSDGDVIVFEVQLGMKQPSELNNEMCK